MVHKYLQSLTTVAGAAAGNLLDIDGHLYFIHIKPATATTVYKFNLTDDDSDIVLQSDWCKGTYTEKCNQILKGSYTVNLTNATANEAFTFKMLVREYR